MPEVDRACKHSPKHRQRAKGCTGERRYVDRIDNNRAIWSGFGNHYWPALYFIDKSGRVRDHHFGEGNYEESETRIRQLLAAAGTGGGIDRESVSVEAHGPEVGTSLVPARRALAVNPLVAQRTD